MSLFSGGGFIASGSDDLFHPCSTIPSSNTFTLPDVPLNPIPHYTIPHQHHCRLLPQNSSSLTSYNNPLFSIPPEIPHDLQPPSTPLPEDMGSRWLGPPPPIPPRPVIYHQSPYHRDTQPTYVHTL